MQRPRGIDSMMEEEEEDVMPFRGLDRSAVLQESKQFSAQTINPRACSATLVKLLFLLGQGELLSETEATEVFFGVTKLFQTDAPQLRRIVYVALKELSAYADQCFVASAQLVKDINSSNDMYRANAIRTLRKITDSSMLGPLERYLKQAAVDKVNNVASAAIVTGLHLSQTMPDLVKRWSSEVNEALKGRGNKVQYHALALLHKLRKSDRLSVTRLVQSVQQGPVKSPLALCLLLKLCTEVLQEDFANSQELYNFVVSCLRHSSDCVVFEAARSMCILRNTTTAKDLSPVILVLQLYLTTHKPVLQFTAVRLLSKIASTHPLVVTPCNVDLETLITDTNRNIATLAITTLLKTGQEHAIERLLKHIATFMSDITDDFKIVVVESTKVLCAKFPHKYAVLLQFLSDILKAEGTLEFKRAIIDAMVTLMEKVPQSKEAGMAHLCDFIQDSEHSTLTARVVHLLGQEGPQSANPHRCMRHIYSRVLLESPVVRAAAVGALAKFGAQVPELRQAAVDLLRQTMQDSDDEVRDRATLFYKVLSLGDESMIRMFICDIAAVVRQEREAVAATITKPKSYVADVVEVEAVKNAASSAPTTGAAAAAAGDGCGPQAMAFRDKLRKVTQLKQLGEPFRTSDPELLTEPDTEYVVKVVKHMYPTHIVLQYAIQNTLEEMVLTKVAMQVTSEDVDAEPKFTLPVARIAPGATEHLYMVFEKHPEGYPTGTFENTLEFAVVDVEDQDEAGGDADDYPIEKLKLTIADYLAPKDFGDFAARWEELGDEQETVNTYALPDIRNLTLAATKFVDFFQLFVASGSLEATGGKVTTKSHTICMSGAMMLPSGDSTPMLLRAKVFVASDNTVAMEIAARGYSPEIREFAMEEFVA
eukprot:PhM_4_TR1729/c0_g1_i1/m.30618/K17267/COPG; coatomer subunit gamma